MSILSEYQRVLDRRRADKAYLAAQAKLKNRRMNYALRSSEMLAEDAAWRQAQRDKRSAVRVLTREEFYR